MPHDVSKATAREAVTRVDSAPVAVGAFRSHRTLRGAAYVLTASLMYAVVGFIVKFGAAGLANETIMFWRSAASVALLAPWALSHVSTCIKVENLRFLFLVALTSSGTTYSLFVAVTMLPVAEATLLCFAAPLYVPFLGFALFGFPLNRSVVAASIVGFVGIALIIKPGYATLNIGILIGLAGGLCSALSTVGIWRMSGEESPLRIVFFIALVSAALFATPALILFEHPTATQWLAMLAAGLCSTLGHLFFSWGCTIASSDKVNTLIYSSIVFAGALGWIGFGESFGFLSLSGAALVVVACIVSTRTRTVKPAGGNQKSKG